jgi:uracil-DNA glycosylase family 4
MGLPLLRGTAEYADCENCPLAKNGRPGIPVFSEFPEDPDFLLISDYPGGAELRFRRPLIGEAGKVVNKMLSAVGQPRERIYVGNALLCMPPDNPRVKEQAIKACSMRLKMELRKFPGKAIMVMGAPSARSIIPKEHLDRIDPADVLPSHKRKQKDKQKSLSVAEKRRKAKEEKLITKLTRYYVKEWIQTRGHKFSKQSFENVEKFHEADFAAIKERVLRETEEELQRQDQELLARHATRRKTKQLGISDIAGTTFKIDVDGTGERIVIPTINPVNVLRGGGKALLGAHTPDLAFYNIVADAAKIKALVAGKNIWLNFDGGIEVNDSEKAADLFYQFYRKAVEAKEYALDLETYVEDEDRHTALQTFKAKIRAIGLAVGDWSISVLWDLLPRWCLDLLRYLLINPDIRLVGHNLLYDRSVLRANGFPCIQDGFDDTLLMHHNAFPGAAHNLQSVTAQFFATSAWKSEFRNNEETPEKLATYCMKDTGSTKQIHKALTFWVKKTQTERSYALDKKMSECASQMHLHGVPVDRDENQILLKQFMEARDKSRETVEHLANDPETLKYIKDQLSLEQAKTKRKKDPDSFAERRLKRLEEIGQKEAKGKWFWKVSANQHVAALLRSQGVELIQVTDKGATKVNKEILESLVEIPIVRDILRYRENDKLISTFVWPLFDHALADGSTSYGFADENSRVHPIWSIHKITGRWASGDPVVSNIPKAKIKKHPDGRIEILRPNIRKQYVAGPGRIFVGFDYGQLEARILALLSKDPFLCDVFLRGKDIHTEAARIIWPDFDKLDPKMQKQTRDKAKPFEYGAFYGADPETLYKNLLKEGFNITREDVYKAYNALMGKLSGVAKYQIDVVEFASQPPFTLKTFVTGRRRVFPLGQIDRNECLNWRIQATAADIMNNGMAIMMERLWKYKAAYPVLQIHDAAVFECWEDDAEKLLADVEDSFTQIHSYDEITIPFPVDGKIAKSWADV